MTTYEEIYFISNLLSNAKADGFVELNNSEAWDSLLLTSKSLVDDDFLFQLNEKGVLSYEEIGEDGFRPIIMCSITPKTREYFKELVIAAEADFSNSERTVEQLNARITEILTFDPKKLSDQIKSTESIISQTKQKLSANPILEPLIIQLDQISVHFKSIRSVSDNYEEIYKNIILPVKEEGKSGVRQTVRWAIISIIISTLLSVIIGQFIK